MIYHGIQIRMQVGVTKLEETNQLVDSLQKELISLQPILNQKAEEAERLLKRSRTCKFPLIKPMVTKQTFEIALVQGCTKRFRCCKASFQ